MIGKTWISLLLLSVCTTMLFERAFGENEAEIEHESCEFWAKSGECDSNPVYMKNSCAEACAKFGKPAPDLKDLPDSIYQIEETDIEGQPLRFSEFQGKVLYIVNVASYCGYTDEGYALLRSLAQYREQGLETIIAPCNQFGFQEPGDATAIREFAVEKHSFDGVILSKKDVNGPGTRPLFSFLKGVTGTNNIDWNFDGKYLVSRTGQVIKVEQHMNVEAEVRKLLESGGSEL